MKSVNTESLPPAAAAAAYGRAMQLQITGRLDLAEPIYRSLLEAEPAHAGANYCLGMLLVQQQRAAEAVPHLLTAINAQTEVADYWLGYLEALLLLGEFGQACDILTLARQQGLAGKAVEDFARRLEAKRQSGDTPNGAAADDAALAAAIRREESALLALVNAGRFREALPLARDMTEHFPECGVGWKILGAMHWAVGNETEAVEAMRTSVRLLPQDAEAHKNLAAAINKKQGLDEAEYYLQHALKIDPDFGPAHLILGHNYQLQGRYAEARASLQAAIELQPAHPSAGLDSARSLLLFVLNNDPSVDADTLFAEHCRVGDYLERTEGAAAPRPRAAHDRNPERCLKVGFVSGDLHNHSVAHFIEPFLSAWQHSRRLKISVYYVNTIDDPVSRRLRGYVSKWNPVFGLSSAQLQERITRDGIDILIDLSGHSALHRLATFARRAAPLQASWLGYPNTTGLRSVDYYLADKHFLPPGKFERLFREKIVHLPAAWSFEPASYAPAVEPLPALATNHLTFGSFNRIAKINEPTVRLWSQLMRAVPDSKMLIAGVPLDKQHLKLIDWFKDRGIARERLSFDAYSSQEAHFAAHHRVDIGLESMPYSGCTTSNHALWMGVPSLTLVGSTPASRLSAANLGQLGLQEFIAESAEEFVAQGARWANDLTALASLRAGLRARWQSAPARNSAFVAAGMELALRHMWRRWCAGLPAQSFEVSAQQAASTAGQ